MEALTPSQKFLLVKQYRPSLNAFTLEFPAGLVDAGEFIEQAARRELLEETGHTIQTVLWISPMIASDPGLTKVGMRLLKVLVDETADEQKRNEEDRKYIEVLKIPRASLLDFLTNSKDVIVDSRLFHFAAGLNKPQ